MFNFCYKEFLYSEIFSKELNLATNNPYKYVLNMKKNVLISITSKEKLEQLLDKKNDIKKNKL